jgi:hypothetical protein
LDAFVDASGQDLVVALGPPRSGHALIVFEAGVEVGQRSGWREVRWQFTSCRGCGGLTIDPDEPGFVDSGRLVIMLHEESHKWCGEKFGGLEYEPELLDRAAGWRFW